MTTPLAFTRKSTTLLERNDGQVLIQGRATDGDHGKLPRLMGPYRVARKDGTVSKTVLTTLKDAIKIGSTL